MVTVADIHNQLCEETAFEINRAGGRAITSVVDVTKAEDTEKLIEKTVQAYGRVDIISRSRKERMRFKN
ncbi:SDR family NAD(P)-dependent oxidoreductase [Brevibacillus brevis]|uniref:SDR family NAD(P)-dependent oxidoreductase n=1 Tax=Brevibacillus brevis TaxID=1393 RepID=A0A517IGR7_BREBE|nr:SDR family NAD(P)-dependent oxidoreductase [Brevibacillus brevis]